MAERNTLLRSFAKLAKKPLWLGADMKVAMKKLH